MLFRATAIFVRWLIVKLPSGWATAAPARSTVAVTVAPKMRRAVFIARPRSGSRRGIVVLVGVREEREACLRLRPALTGRNVLAYEAAILPPIIGSEFERRDRVTEHRAERDIDDVIRQTATAEL